MQRDNSRSAGPALPLALAAVALIGGGCGTSAAPTDPTEPAPTATALAFTSDAVDPIGRGATVSVPAARGYFVSYADRFQFDNTTPSTTYNYLYLTVSTADGGYTLNLLVPRGQTLRNGTFENVHQFETQGPTAVAFEFDRHDARCQGLTARVVVSDLEFGADSSKIKRVRVRWEQHCDATPAASVRGDWAIVAGS